jgi:ubiquinone/menaquinone biosynthesis C-methylase UbiE
MEFNEELARQLDAMYRARDVVRRRRLVLDALAAEDGERILDVGCGPGYYLAELATEVGEGGSVVGVDSSAPMLAVAERRCATLLNTELREGDATALPAGDEDFDAVVSVQLLEYVPDVAAALSEMVRVLRPGGRAVLWDVDWDTLSMHSRDRERADRVLRAWCERPAHAALPQTLAAQMRSAGFEDVGVEGHTFATTELTPDSYGGSLVDLIEPYAAVTVDPDDARAWAAEQRELGERGEFYFAVVQVCFTARRA